MGCLLGALVCWLLCGRLGVVDVGGVLVALAMLFTIVSVVTRRRLSFGNVPVRKDVARFYRGLGSGKFASVNHRGGVALFSKSFANHRTAMKMATASSKGGIFTIIILFSPDKR